MCVCTLKLRYLTEYLHVAPGLRRSPASAADAIAPRSRHPPRQQLPLLCRGFEPQKAQHAAFPGFGRCQYVDARHPAELGANLLDRGFQAGDVAAIGQCLQSVRGSFHDACAIGRFTVTVVAAWGAPANSHRPLWLWTRCALPALPLFSVLVRGHFAASRLCVKLCPF